MSSGLEGVGGAASSIDFYDLPQGTGSEQPTSWVSDAVSDSLRSFHERVGESKESQEVIDRMSSEPTALDAVKMDLNGTGPEASSTVRSIAGTDMVPHSDMPHRSDLGASTEQSIDAITRLGEMSLTSAMFAVGGAVATKADGSIKMFVQAQ